MVYDLPGLPPMNQTLAVVITVATAVVGFAFWLVGARYSRSMVTLVAVALGTLVGLHLPGWFGWAISPPVVAIIGALVLGVSGYLLHRIWLALGVGLLLCSWAIAGTFQMQGQSMAACVEAARNMPAAVDSGHKDGSSATNDSMAWPAGQAVWSAIPEQVRRPLPFVAGLAMVAGVVLTLIWVRLGAVLFYSLLGVTLMLSVGPLVMSHWHPQWLESLLADRAGRVTALAAMVFVGALVQWRWLPSPGGAPAAAQDDE